MIHFSILNSIFKWKFIQIGLSWKIADKAENWENFEMRQKLNLCH